MAKQTFQVGVEFIANINDLQSKIKTVTSDIARLGSSSGGTQVQQQFDALARSITDLQTRAQQPIASQAEFNKLTSDLSKAETAYNNLVGAVQRLQGAADARKLELLPSDQQARIKAAESALKAYENAMSSAGSKAKEFQKLQERLASQKGIKKTATDEIKKYGAAAQEAADKVRTLTTEQEQLNAEYTKALSAQRSAQGKLNSANKSNNAEEIARWTAQLDQARSRVDEIKGKLATLKPQIENATTAETKFNGLLQEAQTRANTAAASIRQIKESLNNLGSGNTQQLQTAFEQLKSKAAELKVDLEGIDDVSSIDVLIQRMQRLKGEGLEEANLTIEKTASLLTGKLGPGLQQAKIQADQAKIAFDRFESQLQELNQLKSYVTYFFSLTNSVYLLRAALQSAFETVKELDSVMTEAAVVTDFSVGDMWERLPQYTSEATKLGASVKDLYSATTLYYQQGLETNAAMSVGIETMKMARIAGMEASEATEAMTAALRGFNMEVNETNAVRINDVYSNLAAITASDTEQIATAMTKTASIASSANMEFETTAALLAQIIETTQEAPETAGTAMKTIIARFSEVKELQNKGLTSGKDEEGEEIDVNKIDKALKSVGISMDGFFAGAQGLDEILLELASIWDTLDFSTQRYIATMAAGSRQQSRFIAMMSDYSRTTELVDAAHNSAGASALQFEKTLDSMEAKINKLKNAWDQFTMTIANNEFLKFAIDALSTVLDKLNKFITYVGEIFGTINEEGDRVDNTFSKIIKSVLSLVTLIGAIRLGKGVLEGAFGFVGGAMEKGRQKAAKKAGVNLDASTNSDVKINSEQIEHDLRQGGESARQNLTVGSKEAGDILVAAAKKAAATEETGAVEEVATEEVGTAEKVATEQVGVVEKVATEEAGAVEKVATEKVGTVEKVATEKAGTVEEVATELAGGVTETGIEEAGAVAEVGTEEAGAVVEAGTEEAGAVAEEAIEVAGGVGKGKGGGSGSGSSGGAAGSGKGVAVAAIIAGITLTIAGLTGLQEAWKEAGDLTKEIEKVDNTIAELQQSIQEAATELKELQSAETALSDMYKDFSKLTKGSKEWKQQLVQINTQVLDLINTYPELAGYVSRDVNGALVISEEGWEEAQAAAEQQQYSAILAQSAAQTQKIELQEAQALYNHQTEEYQKTIQNRRALGLESTHQATGNVVGGVLGTAGAVGGAWAGAKIGTAIGTAAAPGIGTAIGAVAGLALGAIVGGLIGYHGSKAADAAAAEEEELVKERTGGLGTEKFTNFASEAAERGYTVGQTSKEDFKQLYESMGLDEVDGASFDEVYSKMQQLGTDFDELGTETFALQQAQQVYIDSLLMAAAQLDPELADYEHQDAVIEAQGENSEIPEQIEQIKNDILNNDDYIDKDGNAKEELIDKYVEITGKSRDEVNGLIKEGRLSADTMATEIASKQVQNEQTAKMKTTKATIEAVEKKHGKNSAKTNTLLNSLTDQGQGLTLGDLTFISKTATGNSDITALQGNMVNARAYGSAIGSDLAGIDKSTLYENWELASLEFEKINNTLAKAGLELSEMPSNLTAAQMKPMAEQMQLMAAGGATDEQIQGVFDQYAQITENMDPEKAAIFSQALATLDWSNLGEIENFDELLTELGVAVPANELQKLTDGIKEVGNASTKVNLDTFVQQFKNLMKIKDDIATGEKESAIFSKEEKDALIASGVATKEDFVENLDGEWLYIEGTFDQLTAAINKNTDALLGQAKETSKAKSDMARFLTENSGSRAIDLANALSSGDANAVRTIINNAETSGIDLGSLGIEGLTNDTNLNYLDDSVVLGFGSQLSTIGANVSTYEKTAEEIAEESAVTSSFVGSSQANTGGNIATEIEYNTGEFLDQLYYWAEKFNIDRYDEKYAGLYSGDPAAMMEAAGLLRDDIMTERENPSNPAYAQEMAGPQAAYQLGQGLWDMDKNGLTNFVHGPQGAGYYDWEGFHEYTPEVLQADAVKGINQIIQMANNAGFDLSQWGIEGLHNGLDASTLDYDSLMAIAAPALEKAIEQGYYYYENASQYYAATDPWDVNQDGVVEGEVYRDPQGNPVTPYGGYFGFDPNSIYTTDGSYGSENDYHNFISGSDKYVVRGWGTGIGNTFYGNGAGTPTPEDWDYGGGTGYDAWARGGQSYTKGFTDYHKSGGPTEAQDKALRAQAVQYGVSEKILQDYLEAMEGTDTALKRQTASVLANAIEQKKQEKVYGKTLKRLGDVNNEYKTVTKGMQGYEEAVNAYGEALNLDMDVEDNYDFVAENMDLIRQAAEGDIDSILRLNELLAQEHGLRISATGNFDPYNVAVDEAGKVTDEFILKQYQAGAYEIEEQYVEQDMEYLEPIYDNAGMVTGFNKKKALAGQTVQVLKPQDAPSIERAQNYGGAPTGGGGGGEKTKWENPYDEFYNTTEKINEELRKREKLELRYQRLLDRNAATAAEIARLTREQIASLRTERSDREDLLRGRERQMRDIESEYSDVGKYAWYNEQKGQIEIDWALLEGLDGSTDEDLTSRVEEYISKLEEQQELIEEEQDALQEIQDAIWELYEQGKEEYFGLEDQIKEAIIADRQKEIDKLSEINDSINDTNSKLLDSMQEQIDEYRQNRDNEKTEEELTDKQRKLAYLQQDTSGANALEIMQLQEELDQATEDYTDTLIDQKISELQQQNDKAAEQRQQQIDLMQLQLDQYSESAAIWDEVNTLMSEGLDPESGLIRGSRLEELLKSADGFDGMSKLKKMDWLNELNNNIAQALGWLEGGALQNLLGEGGQVTFTDKGGNTVTGTINENGDVETEDGRIYSGDKFKIDQDGNIISYETEDEAKANWAAAQVPEESESDWPSGLIKPSQIEGNVYSGMSGTKVKSVQTALKKLGYDTGAIDSKFGPKTKAAVKKFQKDAKTEGWNPNIGSPDGIVGPRTKQAFKNHPKQFKTGGLADFTGPAWLDGTKSKPEYILNADQTKAFFTLVDVLSGLQANTSKSAEKTGDNTYDIDINVESIGSDYDVEQIAATIKRLINEDARYRNNNTVNLMR